MVLGTYAKAKKRVQEMQRDANFEYDKKLAQNEKLAPKWFYAYTHSPDVHGIIQQAARAPEPDRLNAIKVLRFEKRETSTNRKDQTAHTERLSSPSLQRIYKGCL